MSNRKNLTEGLRFGALTVVSDSGKRSKSGDVYWSCACDCGVSIEALLHNLRAGRQNSCGCQRVERYASAMAAKKPPHCTVRDCMKPVHLKGICLMHYTRLRNHGDVNYITPELVRRKNNRDAQLARISSVKNETYRKMLGRHEHRRVAESVLGRELKPGEVVHHIDGNRHNNSASNLLVMTAAEHSKLHAMERRRDS